jgi:hypothetical protein
VSVAYIQQGCNGDCFKAKKAYGAVFSRFAATED